MRLHAIKILPIYQQSLQNNYIDYYIINEKNIN